MAKQNWLQNKLSLLKDNFDFRLETFILDLTERICDRMKHKGINRTQLADLLGVSPPAVTKILNGNSNFTLKTLLSLSDALGQNLEISFIDKELASIYPFSVVEEAENVTTYVDDKFVSLYHKATVSGSGDTINIMQYDDKEVILEAASGGL
jgi:transcriptional regulator with XRE-family HTH domain